MAGTPERWSLHHHGRLHVVQVEPAGWRRRLVWTLDGEPVLERITSEDTVQLTPGADAPAGAGALGVRFPSWGPARRVTLFEDNGGVDAGSRALVGLGGLDLEPEPGSRAARRDGWIRAHPRLYTVRQTLVAVASVLVPLLLAGLLARFAVTMPWPDWDLPSIPWPDWDPPSIPWPSIPWPSIPLPDVRWPDLTVPAWLREIASAARYVAPVAIAFVLARGEVRRHRQQQRRRTARDRTDGTEATGGTAGTGGTDTATGRGRPADGGDR